MVTLTRLLGAFVGWATASGRRMLAVLAVPVFGAVVLFGPHHSAGLAGQPADGSAATGAGGSAGSGDSGGARDTAGPGDTDGGPGGLPTPTTVTIGPSDRPRPVPSLPAGPRAAATGYVTTANAHDARPGHDHDFADAYRRARRYLTAELYAQVTAPNTRGDFLWNTWVAQQATVTVRVDRVAVPDGAPVPTATTAYVRVRFTQRITPTVGDSRPSSTPGEITMITRRQSDGHWLVAQLLPGS